MSHQPERKEKNCLNCGTIVTGRYCQTCGQENIVNKQSAWGLITHFVYDIFHFDGKFFETLKRLLFRPGTVPKEYIAGRRMSYLDPIRMYLFTSAIFFVVFFYMNKVAFHLGDIIGDSRSMSKIERLEYASVLHQQEKVKPQDSLINKQLNFLLDTTIAIYLGEPETPKNDSAFIINFRGEKYLMKTSVIKEENKEENTGSSWIDRTFNKKWQDYKRKYGDDDKAMLSNLIDTFLHKFPYILFVSLPFFALILKLLYIRRKQFYYSDHAVFTLYHYIFTFILLLFFFLLWGVQNWLDWGFLRTLANILFLSGGIYLFISMKRFYGQKWFKTLGKFLLLNFLALAVVGFLMFGFILLSVFQL